MVYSWNELYNTEVGNHVFILTEKNGIKADKMPESLQMSSAADSNAAKAEVPLSSRVTDTSVYASVSEDRIRQRAYELYMQRGGKHGAHVDDWFRAEAELRGRR